MGKFNIKKDNKNKTVNLAGGIAYKYDVKTELVFAVLTTFLEDKYYEKQEDRIARIQDLIAKNDSTFVAKLAVMARKSFHLRSVTTLLLGELSNKHKGDSLVSNTIIECCERVDDLTELLAYIQNKGYNITEQIRKGIRRSILKFDRYQLAKYKGERDTISLVDLFNLCHPNPKYANEEQKEAWKDLIEGNLKSFDTWEVELSGAKDDTERREKLSELILTNKIGYMALLRNLNNIDKYNCNQEVIKHAQDRLQDSKEVWESKQLPFRFMTAINNADNKWRDCLSIALEHSVDNIEDIKGKTLIALDSSGSMEGDPFEKGSIFGMSLFKKCYDVDFILYDTSIKELNISKRSILLDLVETAKRENMGGGTNTSLVYSYATENNTQINSIVYDNIIIISDNESWVSPTDISIKNYVNNFPKTKIYNIDIQGLGTKESDNKNIVHISGWSDKILEYIKCVDNNNLVTDIENTVLNDYINKDNSKLE